MAAPHLTSARTRINKWLADSCQIQRPTLASDAAGGQTESWATVTTVACHVAPTGSQAAERLIAERLTSDVPWTIRLPFGTDARATDRIVSGGRTYEVIAPLSPRTDEVVVKTLCRQVT